MTNSKTGLDPAANLIINHVKTVDKLYQRFCKTFADEDQSYYLFQRDFFNDFCNRKATLPLNPTLADSYQFVVLPIGSNLKTGHPLLVPQHLVSIFHNNLKTSWVPKKTGFFEFSFTYKLSRYILGIYDSKFKAETAFRNFKELELLKAYLNSSTDYERHLLQPFVRLTMATSFSKTTDTRVLGKKTWAYITWANFKSGLQEAGYQAFTKDLKITADTKVVDGRLLDFDCFSVLISTLKKCNQIENAILNYTLFGDAVLTPETLFYLPKALVQNHKAWIDSSNFTPTQIPTGYCFRCRNHQGVRVSSPVFKTELEAVQAYRDFKFETLTKVYQQYQPKLPPLFCQRFENEVLNAHH